MRKPILFLFLFFLLLDITAQQNSLYGWHLKDKNKDGYYGISLEQAYQFLAANHVKSTPIIVAVLDSGIDTAHEDLKPVLWINNKEIPGNHKDDDGNGYADDVHGWNFLGGPDGRNVNEASSEWIRVYWRYKKKYEGVRINTDSLTPEQRYEYALWQKARAGVVGQGMKEEELSNLLKLSETAVFCDSVLKVHFPRNEYTEKDLVAYKPADKLEKQIKDYLLAVFKMTQQPDVKNTMLISDLKTYATGEQRRAMGDKIPPVEYHIEITGDDEKNPQTKYYGNSDIEAGNALHGTHVSGIIAAVRNNGIGMDGIADNVKIMMLRTTPD